MVQIANPFEAHIQKEVGRAASSILILARLITEAPGETQEQRLDYALGLVRTELLDPTPPPFYSGNTQVPIPLAPGEEPQTIGQAVFGRFSSNHSTNTEAPVVNKSIHIFIVNLFQKVLPGMKTPTLFLLDVSLQDFRRARFMK